MKMMKNRDHLMQNRKVVVGSGFEVALSQQIPLVMVNGHGSSLAESINSSKKSTIYNSHFGFDHVQDKSPYQN